MRSPWSAAEEPDQEEFTQVQALRPLTSSDVHVVAQKEYMPASVIALHVKKVLSSQSQCASSSPEIQYL